MKCIGINNSFGQLHWPVILTLILLTLNSNLTLTFADDVLEMEVSSSTPCDASQGGKTMSIIRFSCSEIEEEVTMLST